MATGDPDPSAGPQSSLGRNRGVDMKRLAFVGLAIGAVVGCATNLDDGIGEIQREIERIRSHVTTMQETQRVLLGISAEGAGVTAYRENGTVRWVAVEALGETGKYLADFYFGNEQLLYAHVKLIDYGGDIMEGLEGKKLEENVVEEDRLFLADGKLIRWLQFEDPISTSDGRFDERRQEILAEARSFMLLMETSAPEQGEEHCDWICDQEQDHHCVRYKCE